MLPAIWFIFSRRECDLAARQLAMHGVQLASNEGEWSWDWLVMMGIQNSHR